MKNLVWIRRGAMSPRIKSHLELLERHDLHCLEVAATRTKFPSAAKLTEALKSRPEAVLISTQDPAWAANVTRSLRAESSLYSMIPFLWIHGKLAAQHWEVLRGAALDDIFPLTGKPEELLFRLQRRIAEAELRQAREAHSQEQSGRLAKSETGMKQREEFLSVCAHDLRSPLGLIQSSIAMVLNAEKERASLSPMHVELLTRAKRQAGHALGLVNDLLDVMALEQGLKPQYQLLDLHSLLTEFFQDYTFQAQQKNITFHYANPIPKWRVLADGDRIRQLLQNLCVNAIKFTDPGKNIFLSVLPFQGKRKNDPIYPMLVIGLRDEGRGIPHDEVQKIFDRFSQLKDSSRAEGRGLGLTVSKQISTLHDGNLWVQSEEGKGSTFFVLLPHVISRLEADKPDPTAKRRLLIAEPVPARRDAYYKDWNDDNWEVLYARDGVEALTLLFHWMPEVLVFTTGLAKLDEVEAANIAKHDPLTSRIPVLLALDSEQKPLKKHENMAYDGLLSLPSSREGLLELLKNLNLKPKKAA